MTKNQKAQSYRDLYIHTRFERAGLFQAVREYDRGIVTVLYPGSSIHITPSFYFPHVVYVDTGQSAQKFFAGQKDVLDLINHYKKYKQSAYINFLAHDFTEDLPLLENSFDLLLSLYAGGIARSCKKYLRPGGCLLTNNHHGDALEAADDREYHFLGLFRKKANKYRFTDITLDKGALLKRRDTGKNKVYRNQSDGNIEYKDNEDFYLFRKVSPMSINQGIPEIPHRNSRRTRSPDQKLPTPSSLNLLIDSSYPLFIN